LSVDDYEVVVIGAGPSGAAAAEAYRDGGGTGRVALLGAEEDEPYHRPSLSKEYMRGEIGAAELALRDGGFYDDRGIDLRTGAEVGAIDLGSRSVTLSSGERIGFRNCVLATGARPAAPPVPVTAGPQISVLRTRSDSDALAASSDGHVLVVGSGFIGCETAASIAMRGGRVTLATDEPAPQRGRLGEVVAARIARWLRELGVELTTSAPLRRIEAGPRAQIGDRWIEPDRVLLALGIEPRAELALGAGLELRDGRVPVDSRMRSAAETLLAVGDVCLAENATAGRPLIVEHWGEALNHGAVAGAHLAGDRDAEWDSAPGFWTTIGERTLKYVAWGDGFDDVEVDDRADGSLVATYARGGRVVGVLTHEDDAAYERGRELVESGAPS
jgi:NADPH-dependent 2,4-dienoyl-CoA reductase/sulfur reductase-like enzyme